MTHNVESLFTGGALNSTIGLIIGLAEGNRTADGGVTDSYYGHTDPGNGAWNVGNYSVNGEYYSCSSPEYADSMYHKILQGEAIRVAPVIEAMGLDSSNALLMANYLDVWNQSPLMAIDGFLCALPYLVDNGITEETVLMVRVYAGDEGVGPGFNPTGYAHASLWTDMKGHVADQTRRAEAIATAIRNIRAM